jgi:hypothetical protein
MIKKLIAVAVLGSVGGFAGVAMAQGKQGEALASDVSAYQEKLEAQCAHRRRTMPPDPRDDCFRRLRSDGHFGYGQVGAPANSSQASGAGPVSGGNQGVGPGNAQGIGPGSGGGQGKGRR